MKLHNKLGLSIKIISKHKAIFLMLFIMSVLAMYLLDSVLMLYVGPKYRLNVTEQSYKQGAYNSYSINLSAKTIGSEIPLKDRKEFFEYLYGLECFRISGAFSELNIDLQETEYTHIPVVLIDSELVEFGNIELNKVSEAGNLYLGDKQIFRILGSEVEDESEIERLREKIVDGKIDGISYAGTIDKNSLFSREISVDYFSLSFIELERVGLLLVDKHTMLEEYIGDSTNSINQFYFVFKENITEIQRQEVINQIEYQALKYDFSVSIENLGDRLDAAYGKIGLGDNKRFVGTILILVLAVISMMCATLISLFVRKKEYGIMYAMGISQRDVSFMITIQNMLVVVPAILVAFAYEHSKICYAVNGEQLMPLYYNEIHFLKLLPGMFIVGCVIVIAATIIPVIVINRMKVAELTKGAE